MPGYLLDTNTLFALYDASHAKHPNVMAAQSALPGNSPIYVSAITRGEVLYGHAFDRAGENEFRAKYRAFVDALPQALEVSRHTAEPYAEIRAELCKSFAPPGGWKPKKRAEQLYDPVAARELGIDENDLWLVAQAVERNLVLVSEDKITRIKNAVKSVYSGFRTENWCT